MTDRPHDHHRHHHHPASPAPVERRAAALEALLVERGLINPGTIDAVRRAYETQIGPLNGAKAVVRAWLDPSYKSRLLTDGRRAVAELGIGGPEIEYLRVVENTPTVHNVVVCTLCSCYPWAVLGLPPRWYKDPPYRSRMVREPRVLLAEMGCVIDDSVDIQVWDSSADMRYLVLPMRPAGTHDLSEPELAALVTRDAMIGVARL
jgi:nitrile hydratase